MSLERVVDDLARTLAEPMPRRRALRLLGGSLAAAVVPGVAPRATLAARRSRAATCPPAHSDCPFDHDGDYRTPDKRYCCEGPEPQFSCGDIAGPPKCINHCPPTSPTTGKRQTPCFSQAKWPNGQSKKYNCCTDLFPKCDDGECLPDCEKLAGPGSHPCGQHCCHRSQACANPKTSTCGACRQRRVCGSDCCEPGEKCMNGKCCPAERVCGAKCCPNGQTCKGGKCCPSSRACGPKCCGRGTKCAFSGRSRVCCPTGRIVSSEIRGQLTRFCCPAGTVRVRSRPRGALVCCPPGQAGCCDEEDLAPLVPGGEELAPLIGPRVFCVRGRMRRL